MIDETIVVGAFQCNCRLLVCEETGEAALIDPGDEPRKILGAIERAQANLDKPLSVKYLLHTHAHLDHIGATRNVREALADTQGEVIPQIFLHKGDEPLYRALKQQGQMMGFRYDDPLPVDQYFEDEQDLSVGRIKMSVLHTPGHSPGSCCLRLHEDSEVGSAESVYSGDTLFQFSVGRTDLMGGDMGALIRSIKGRLLTLDDDTRVCPGHGPETKIGLEKRVNPFLT